METVKYMVNKSVLELVGAAVQIKLKGVQLPLRFKITGFVEYKSVEGVPKTLRGFEGYDDEGLNRAIELDEIEYIYGG